MRSRSDIGRCAVEVEVGVVGEVDRARGVNRCAVRHADTKPVFEAVTDGRREVAGITLIAVGGLDPEQHMRRALLQYLPAPTAEAVRPAVQLVYALIGRQLIDAAFALDACVSDAVGKAADGYAEIALLREIIGQ